MLFKDSATKVIIFFWNKMFS